MARRLLFGLLSALMLAATAGCGYHLRGVGVETPAFTDLRLRLSESGPAFERTLRRGLTAAGIALHDAGAAEVRRFPLLAIGPEMFSGRPASTTAQARTAQVNLRLAIQIQLTDGEVALIDRETLSVERTYYQDLRNIAGNREEAELLREEMRRELAVRLTRRLLAAGR